MMGNTFLFIAFYAFNYNLFFVNYFGGILCFLITSQKLHIHRDIFRHAVLQNHTRGRCQRGVQRQIMWTPVNSPVSFGLLQTSLLLLLERYQVMWFSVTYFPFLVVKMSEVQVVLFTFQSNWTRVQLELFSASERMLTTHHNFSGSSHIYGSCNHI